MQPTLKDRLSTALFCARNTGSPTGQRGYVVRRDMALLRGGDMNPNGRAAQRRLRQRFGRHGVAA